ncbi:E3 ubiquitin-protein ligase TRIM33-like [Mercenaria mercenaria]|uniref:E3 ubiquitin-protein ligase TRIM33-like n=1 Tax=Mercenaria mercenaria TaxID=6596 RepID=UPI00234E46F8|nr:E3 ubiquitin-protein ligase TRIM33-like [Mercenaria mercenaria]
MALSRPSSQMTRYTSNENRMAYSRPSSQMTRYTAMSPTPTSRVLSPSPPPFSRPSSVMSRHSKSAPSVKLTKGNPMKCNVCKNKLEYQWILPGLHNFCAHCLEDYILRHSRGKRCHCPICRAGIRLPKEPRHPKKIARYPLGTDLVICDVCEDSPAFYKCSECNEYFCEKCNKLHLRMRMGRDHHVNIIPSIRAVNDKLKVKVYCDEHEHEEIKFHCKKCDVPICRDCKVIQHEGHLTTALKEIVDERKIRVTTAMTTARGHLARLKAEAIEIKNRKSALEEETEQTTHDIKQHALRMKDIVDEHSGHLIQTVRQQHDESISKLDNCLEQVSKKTENIKGLLDTASVQMDTSTDVAFINSSQSLNESLRAADIPSFTDKLWRKRLTFARGDIDEIAIQQAVGDLKFSAEGLFVPLPAIELQLMSTFNTDQNFRSTSSITTQNDATAWVCNGYRNKIQRFDIKGRIIQVDTTEFDIDDMTTLNDGTVLLTEYNGKAIRKLSSTHFESYFAKTDLYLRGITTSRDGSNVIVVGNDVPVTKSKQIRHAKVLIFSTTGRRIREIHINKGLSLFRICHTVNGDFVISTGVSAKYLVINSDGMTKYTYTASGSADGVTCDAHGLTILSDLKDDTLHLLDSKGKPLPFTYSLNKPNAVAVDNRGHIWVGDLNKIRIMKYV